jgi:cysteine synthase
MWASPWSRTAGVSGSSGPHKIRASAGFTGHPQPEIIDEVTVANDCLLTEERRRGRHPLRYLGGAAAWAARGRPPPQNSGKTIVVILPDTGER